jgi:hypothetical protein
MLLLSGKTVNLAPVLISKENGNFTGSHPLLLPQ